ncbi:MAG: hypothetical protein IJZ36_04165 [Bacilli bacterium]|nr:hypothetical protein [Bacilli bacterium]
MIVNFKIVDNCIYGEYEGEMYLWGNLTKKYIRWTNFGNSQLSKDTKNFIKHCVLQNS